MKKSLLTIASITVAMSLSAQVKNKNGVSVLPETGEYGISIDATPFLNYFGQLLSNTGSVAPTWNFLNGNNTIIGKKMIDANTAYRGILRIGFGSTSTTALITDARETPAPVYPAISKMVEDKRKVSTNFIGIGAGLEKRRGSTRVQGIYGADAMIWMNGGKTTYDYGNALADTIPVNFATTTNFGTNLVADSYGNSARMTENKMGTTIGFGLRAFVGVEYFVAPRISLGAEFGWGFGLAFTGEGSNTRESVNGVDGAIGSQEMKTGKTSEFMLDVDRNAFGTGNGALKLNFYF